MAETAIEMNGELLEALALVAPEVPSKELWNRLIEYSLSRGGRPRKTGRAARPVSGPVTLAELGFRKGFLAEARDVLARGATGKHIAARIKSLRSEADELQDREAQNSKH